LTRSGLLLALVALAGIAGGPAVAQMAAPEIPFLEDWAGSPHALKSAEAFNHWNKEGEIPPECARCHSTPGFLDYIGADGSAPGKVDKPAPTGTVIACVACHNDTTMAMTEVTFPSGLKVIDLGGEARCMTCHQGRQSTFSVNEHLAGMADDTASEKIQFLNVHYRAAAATRYGTQAKGAYEYGGKDYKGFNRHVTGLTRCIDCHATHSVEIRVEECKSCHGAQAGIESEKDLRRIRQTKTDYDGDGNTAEGVADEIETLFQALYKALQSYAKEVAGQAIVYDPHQYPYFFVDSDGDGATDADEAKYPNRYQSWTPRLLRAAYNYQFVAKDPGAFAHNPRYVVQILYDSLADLGTRVAVDMRGMGRP